ncbi:GNAT family N-acetyltransferase [Streptomyces millisiae]|uniref:GNAT family N-acetyltransferase n=1 Tax=Streptomyces millisiae TaxID=3075542 RepID=A0ABU2LKR9_9ACTN|nr:GNAT family N-acetyltransferase [Streptomyces sp. DSM 44918]MDT0318179.1 GNAT family N-acetyltransferase [Streptomyces sp. DSM 44918]
MGRQLVPLTLDNLADLPSSCQACVFWELDPVSGRDAERTGRSESEKKSWVSTVLEEWGSCGRLAYVDGRPVGFVLYAPPAYVPRGSAFPTSPVSADAVQLITARIESGSQHQGLGRVLIQSMAKDLLGRGIRAIEAFGDARWEQPRCVLPAEYLWAVGFETARPHPAFPRLRLELRRAVSWRADMELALDRLLAGAKARPAFHPS